MPLRVDARGIHIPAFTRVCMHGDLTFEGGQVGQAIKQAGYTIATPRALVQQIQVGEQGFLVTEGIVETPAIAGATLGQPVAITPATGVVALGVAVAPQVKVGRVATLPGTYGCPTGALWVDLDAKDSL